MADVIRIGAFFDGTGNNMWNDLAIGDKSETNVAKIYKMYAQQAKDNPGYYAKPLYVEGVGTEKYREGQPTLTSAEVKEIQDALKSRNDFYSSYNMAFGDEAKSKVNRMLEMVKNEIKKNPDAQIIVDVYGFSRGATEARDFINEFNSLYANVNKGSAIGFVGLFDTVSSLGFANSINIGFNLNLNDASAAKIVQIDAANEMRANFPLELLNNPHSKPRIAA
ncbi:phospholipase effector Tle1 domain-containing protein [Sulfuricurvum sp.]|uniref:phospholipase effector Tle1 domain-containing protein n=1 Tax=Sulfuricurvum sp. TaxID=2025608 RepID=UPI003BB57D0D